MNKKQNMAKTNDELLTLYFKDIGRVPLLTREEERDLAACAAAGDKAARDKLVSANLRFVVSIAKKYANRSLDLLDLIEEGNIGLIEAIDRYDVDKGYRFISYAVWWIRKAIFRYVSENSMDMHLPVNRQDDLRHIVQLLEKTSANKTNAETIKAISEELGIEEDIVRELMSLSQGSVSLDSPIFCDDELHTLGDVVVDTVSASPEESAIQACIVKDVKNALTNLKATEAEVLRYRYGLHQNKPLTLHEIGTKINVSKERVRQIEKSAVFHMQNSYRTSRLAQYIV